MNMLRFAFSMIRKQFKKFILSILLMGISFVLIMLAALINSEGNSAYTTCDEVLSAGIEGTAVIRMEDSSYEQIKDFLKKAYESEEIAATGGMNSGSLGGKIDDKLYEIQRGHDWDTNLDSSMSTEVARLSPYVVPLCDIKLKEGTPVEELDYNEEGVVYLYLGSAYEGIPIGTEDVSSGGTKIVVAGIMENNQRWIKESLLNGFSASELDYSVDCTYAVFCVGVGFIGGSDTYFISAEEGYTIEQAISKAEEIGRELGVEFKYDTVKAMYEEDAKNTEALMNYFSKLSVIITIASTIMLISIQLVIVVNGSREYGVMHSIGFSEREVMGMLLWKQIITAVIALIISGVAVTYIAKEKILGAVSMEYMLQTLLFRYVFPAGIIFAAGITAIVHVVTIIMLRTMTPVRLINNKM